MTAAEYCQRYNGNRQAGLPRMLFFVNINVAKLIRKLPFRPENSLFFYHEAHGGHEEKRLKKFILAQIRGVAEERIVKIKNIKLQI